MRVPLTYSTQQQHPVSTAGQTSGNNNRRLRCQSQVMNMEISPTNFCTFPNLAQSIHETVPIRNAAKEVQQTLPTTQRPNSTSNAPASTSDSLSSEPEIPNYLHDPILNRNYVRGRFLGKGGFAWCYEVTDVRSHGVFALKVVPKTRVIKQRHRHKVFREISLHQPLRHTHIVRLYSAFEDEYNIYMVLELCQYDSLVSVMKKRKTITECETRYYMMQLLTGVQYLHDEARILHRDLKLGNMLLTDQMRVKIADFGLATEMGRDDRIGQVCGTPNYISPEVLRKEGHSSASEAWAMGCIMYAMLVGKPPFETSSLDATYALILACQYSIPTHVQLSSSARDLIRQLLHPNPALRPTPAQAMTHQFFSAAIPVSLPPEASYSFPNLSQILYAATQTKPVQSTSSYSTQRLRCEVPFTQPIKIRSTKTTATYQSTQFDFNQHYISAKQVKVTTSSCSNFVHSTQHPVPLFNQMTSTTATVSTISPYSSSSTSATQPTTTRNNSNNGSAFNAVCALDTFGNTTFGSVRENALTQWLYDMYHSLDETLYFAQGCRSGLTQATAKNFNIDTSVLYVTKWIDYSNRYGFGCQFNNGGVSIMQNDRTRLCLSTDRRFCRRWFTNPASNGSVCGSELLDLWEPANVAQESLDTIRHFVDYMDVNLMMGGFSDGSGSLTVAVPFIVLWRRFSEYLLIILSDGTFQINFISHHTKVVLSRLPVASNKTEVALTYIDESRLARTCPLRQSIGNVIDRALLQRVRDLLSDYVLSPNDCCTAEI